MGVAKYLKESSTFKWVLLKEDLYGIIMVSRAHKMCKSGLDPIDCKSSFQFWREAETKLGCQFRVVKPPQMVHPSSPLNSEYPAKRVINGYFFFTEKYSLMCLLVSPTVTESLLCNIIVLRAKVKFSGANMRLQGVSPDWNRCLNMRSDTELAINVDPEINYRALTSQRTMVTT